MKTNFWCRFLGLHKYEILKEEKLLNRHGNQIGIVIISKCIICGNINQTIIYTEI